VRNLGHATEGKERHGEAPMTDDDKYYGVYARLHPPPHKVAEAVADYKARQEAERAKVAKLREQRLAAETKAGGETKPKAKRKAGGKAKRS